MSANMDVESPPPLGQKQSNGLSFRNELTVKETSGLLLTWSICAMIEGGIRLVRNANPELGLNPPGPGIPPAAFLAGGIAEVIFGGAGVLLAVLVFLFGMRSQAAVLGFLGLQAVLGWFVFLLFVIADPIRKMIDQEEGMLGMSVGLTRFNIFLGMITSIVWCAALQSGQFTHALRILEALKGNNEKTSKHRLRAIVWSALAALAGLSMCLAGGTQVGNLIGSAPYLRPPSGGKGIPVFPPHVGIYPGLILACGIVTFIWGLIGTAGVITKARALLTVFHYSWFLVFMANVITFGLVLGREMDGFFAFATAQHILLSLVFTLLPVVFTSKLVSKDELSVMGSEA